MSYTESTLWTNTLAETAPGGCIPERERLRNTYIRFREHATLLAGEIERWLPGYTVHDQSHFDALWEMASLIAGPDYPLNPLEAFVLGGSFLVHDLGMGLAAYPGGDPEIRNTQIYSDMLVLLRRTHAESEARRLAFEYALRSKHAAAVENLPIYQWQDPGTGQAFFFIEDSALRYGYGRAIGRIAHSHNWSPEHVCSEFGTKLGACAGFPDSWEVDQLKVAFLLRVADAAHIDQRRAPGLLAAVRLPAAPSRVHWESQGRIHKPRVESDSLVFTSGSAFTRSNAPAWWLNWDKLRAVNWELRAANMYLEEAGRKQFRSRWVRGTDSVEQMRKYLPTDGWSPVDAQVRVSDISRLIESLGGEQLYGRNSDAPLRELIQNAMDATRARRVMRGFSEEWGDVYVRTGSDKAGHWIEVEDNGTGMSRQLLTGAFLDFGHSYWRSEHVCDELPGLLSKGFTPTGEYGIGFFSIFIWGQRVRVTTRHLSEAPAETKVLEFNDGLSERPLLRIAESDERREDPGTCVRVWTSSRIPGALLASNAVQMRDYCASLCPSSDVSLQIQQAGAAPLYAVKASDWKTMDGGELLRRVWSQADRQGHDGLCNRNAELLGKILKPVLDAEGNLIGRACIAATSFPFPVWAQTGVVTVGGLRSCYVTEIAGVLIGRSLRASRDVARPTAEGEPLAKWATEQALLIKKLGEPSIDPLKAATAVLACGGHPGDLPFARALDGLVGIRRIVESVTGATEVLILAPGRELDEALASGLQLLRNVLLPASLGSVCVQSGTPTVDWPADRAARGSLRAVVDACAQAWRGDPVKMYQDATSKESIAKRKVGHLPNAAPFETTVRVLTRP
jgi:hypothetical protein